MSTEQEDTAYVNKLLDLMRSLEWAGSGVEHGGDCWQCCPSCGGAKPGESGFSIGSHGHASTCRLAPFLKDRA
jgi:hypothetical protein